MNTIQMIWSTLTSQNEALTNILLIPLAFVDAYVCMMYFSTILNIQSSKKSKIIYVVTYGIIAILLTFFVPSPYSIFVNLILWPLMVFFLLKTTILKSILSEVISMMTSAVLEFLFANMFLTIFNISSELIREIPIFRLAVAFSIYLIIFLLTKLIKTFKVNIVVFENMNTKTKILLIINALLVVLVLGMQFYLILFYSNNMPPFITIINIIGLIAYFSVSIATIVSSSKLESTRQDLQSEQLANHSLTILHDQVRSFKHDFDNIVNSIGGYVINEDIEGLKKYYNQLLKECHKTNNLYALSPKVINHPAIYHMLATKYYEANQLNVEITLNVFLDLNEIEARMQIYDFTRILGILLDNAIDAAKECEKKIINVTFRKEISNDMIIVKIENTYNDKNVDTEKIYNKGETSKENHSGLGLWKVRQILMHNNNLNLFTTKDDEFFSQQFEIYK